MSAEKSGLALTLLLLLVACGSSSRSAATPTTDSTPAAPAPHPTASALPARAVNACSLLTAADLGSLPHPVKQHAQSAASECDFGLGTRGGTTLRVYTAVASVAGLHRAADSSAAGCSATPTARTDTGVGEAALIVTCDDGYAQEYTMVRGVFVEVSYEFSGSGANATSALAKARALAITAVGRVP
jgi:hypothetical protein